VGVVSCEAEQCSTSTFAGTREDERSTSVRRPSKQSPADINCIAHTGSEGAAGKDGEASSHA
jgi:hypothetical protein